MISPNLKGYLISKDDWMNQLSLKMIQQKTNSNDDDDDDDDRNEKIPA